MIYRLRITAAAPKDFLRIVEIKTSQTLYTLHEHLQNDLGYAPDQMIVFRTPAEGKKKKQYGLFDMGDGSIDTLTLAGLKRKHKLELQYVFDLRNDRFLKIELIEEDDASPRKTYPRTTDEKGLPPNQFSARTPAGEPLAGFDNDD
jgi:hypothetical protein